MPRRVRNTDKNVVVLDDLSSVNAADVLELIRHSHGRIEYPPGRRLTRRDIEKLDAALSSSVPGFLGLVYVARLSKLLKRIRQTPSEAGGGGVPASPTSTEASASSSSLSRPDDRDIRALAARDPASAWVLAGGNAGLQGIVRQVFWGTPRS